MKGSSFAEAIHRAVAKAFIPNPENKPFVNHINGNKHDNRVENLEWVTCSENHAHAYKLGLRNKEHHRRVMTGKKLKGSSKYHNVYWDKTRQRWKTSIKAHGKTIYQKRHKDEVDAALDANRALDMFGLTHYPKNNIS